jgi:hypothetical protein
VTGSERPEPETASASAVGAGAESVLLDKIEKLERELNTIKQTTSAQAQAPTVQHHHWNIVLGMDFFDELVMKMGREHTINFLSGIATEGKPVDVINKLYLEGNIPTDYPIACRDRDHFRYIDSDHRLVDDKGGHGISNIVTAGVKDALISAANEDGGSFDVDVLQKYVADRDRVISDLAHITSIPNHPFFKLDEQSDDQGVPSVHSGITMSGN